MDTFVMSVLLVTPLAYIDFGILVAEEVKGKDERFLNETVGKARDLNCWRR